MDFLGKELVNSYFYTDFNMCRCYSKGVVINGRNYLKFGTYTATTLVANIYKVYDPSVKLNKYVALVGMSRQHPCDVKITKEEGIEIANINANVNPIMSIVFDSPVEYYDFKPIAEAYIGKLDKQLIKTKDEIIADGNEEMLLYKQYRR